MRTSRCSSIASARCAVGASSSTAGSDAIYPANGATGDAVDTTRKPLTVPGLVAMTATGERIAMLTCYDASFAAVCDRAGVDALLVGDSLGMVVQGERTTLRVTVEQMAYHVACVARGLAGVQGRAVVIGDLPFASYHESAAQAFASAASLMRAGAQMVKLEGAGGDNAWYVDAIAALVARGIPVCAHLGLTPQSVHQLGGFRVQGRDAAVSERLVRDAAAVEAAGASMLVLEMVPAPLAAAVAARLAIPVVGIGAGAGCDGQVLVLHDMLGLYPGRRPRFVMDFTRAEDGAQRSVDDAIRAYVAAVKEGRFPAPAQSFE